MTGCVFCGKPRELIDGGEWAGWRCTDTKCEGWATQHRAELVRDTPERIEGLYYGFIKRAADEDVEPEDWDKWALTALWNQAQIEAGLRLAGVPISQGQETRS